MKVLSVSELTTAIKSLLEPSFRAVAVRGEISNFKLQSSGHLYFSVKDSGAQLSAALFKASAARLPRTPKDGDQVIAIGELSIYAPRGAYQIIVRELQFLGTGELLLKFQQLKENLAARGWFEKSRKKPLPKLPRRIGVVTSPTGAVIQDILNILTRRFQGFQVLLNPVRVQGEGAAAEIAQAIHDFNRHALADVLIVGRGGGSIEDLWAFNEESVAQAIFESKIPIISAVGHETDVTIADWVADVRAPTPSAAAEIAIAEKANLLKFLDHVETVATERVRQSVRACRQRLQALQRHPALAQPKSLLFQPFQQLDALAQDLKETFERSLSNQRKRLDFCAKQRALLDPSRQLARLRAQLVTLSDSALRAIKAQTERQRERLAFFPETLAQAIRSFVDRKQERLTRMEGHLRSIDPKNLMRKGYAILFAENGRSLILSAEQIAPEQKIVALLHDGKIGAVVQTVDYDK